MGFADKAKNKAEELAGKAKAATGDATDNRDLEAEGRMQESKADVKQAGENVKDSGDDVADALRAASGATKFDDGDTTRLGDDNTQGTRTISSPLLSSRSFESFGDLGGLSKCVGGHAWQLRLPSQDGKRG